MDGFGRHSFCLPCLSSRSFWSAAITLPDIVAVPYTLALLFLVPACIGCGFALAVLTLRRMGTTVGKVIGVLISIAEIGVGVALGIGLAGVKFITPQT